MSRYVRMQKLLSKIAVKRFMDNFRKNLSDLGIRDSELSKVAGKHFGAFNKTINAAEDLRFSSFMRFWNAALSLTTDKEQGSLHSFDFNLLMDHEVRNILHMITELSPSDLGNNTPNIKSRDLIALKVYVDLLVKQKAISTAEEAEYLNMIEELRRQEGQCEN